MPAAVTFFFAAVAALLLFAAASRHARDTRHSEVVRGDDDL